MFRRIRIQNFRSLRDVTVEFGPVTVLVGRSGSGKTNFISAIRFLRDILRGGQPSLLQRGSLLPATDTSANISLEIDFNVPGYDDLFSYRATLLGDGLTNPRMAQEFLRLGSRELFHQKLQESKFTWITPPPLATPPKPGQLALGHLPGIEEVVVAFSVLAEGIGVYSFALTALRNNEEKTRTGLADDAGNYVRVLRNIMSNVKESKNRRLIAAALARLNPTVASIDLDSLQQPTSAVVGHRLGDKILTMDLASESDGFRRFYAHLLALYQLPPKQLLIFEEPENGIYPGALSLLAEEFKAAPASGRGQVLLTTHSPRLLDHFSADEIRVVELDENLETHIGPLANEQRAAIEDDLLDTGELLTVDPARMETARS